MVIPLKHKITKGRAVHGFRFGGVRHDCGSKLNVHKATVASGLSRTDLGEAFRASLYAMKGLSQAA